jgi:hypothetical protein
LYAKGAVLELGLPAWIYPGKFLKTKCMVRSRLFWLLPTFVFCSTIPSGWGEEPDDETLCNEQRQFELDSAHRHPPELFSLKTGIPMDVTENLSVTEGSWEKRIELAEAGILSASLPKASDSQYDIMIAREADIDPDHHWVGINGVLAQNTPFQILLTAGVYRIRLQESVEEGDYEPPCPVKPQGLVLIVSPLSGAMEAMAKDVSSDPQQPLSLGLIPHRQNVLLTRLSPAVTFSTEVGSIALVTIDDVRRGAGVSARVEYGRSGGVAEIHGHQQRILTEPGKMHLRISLDDTDLLELTDAATASFQISALMGTATAKNLFEPTGAAGASFPGPTVQFRNVSGLDLNGVKLYFDYRRLETHYQGFQEVSAWRKGQIQNFTFPAAPIQPLGLESLDLEVKAVDDAEINSALAHPKYPLMEAPPFFVPSQEYDKKIKLPVWKYCGQIASGYGREFNVCQNRWLKEEFTCRRLQDPRQPAFIDCVRGGIANNFPEMLPHLGQ